MTSRIGRSISLVALAFLAGAPVGCGKTKNVLTSLNDGGTSAPENDGSVASTRGNGRGGQGGSRGGAGAGRGGEAAQTDAGVAGASTEPSSGGAAGSLGVAGAAGASSSAGGNGAAFEMIDPHAAERKQLAQDMCALLSKYPCVVPNLPEAPTREEQVDACVKYLQTFQYSAYGDKCWDEWVANAKCGIARTDYCPCALLENECNLGIGSFDFGLPCFGTNRALDACRNGVHAAGTETGKAGTCRWYAGEATGCNEMCEDKPDIFIGAECEGPPNGAQDCYCTVNGVFLGDQAQFIQSGSYLTWLGEDCADVARQLAAGKCADVLDCCFSWTYTPAGSANPVADCGCTADPKQAGYATCEALAAAGNGKVVDYCARYRPMPGTFPIPPGPDTPSSSTP